MNAPVIPSDRLTALDLPWLVPQSAFGERLKAVGTVGDLSVWDELVALANTRLGALDTVRLDRRLTSLFPAPPAKLVAPPIRLLLLGSSTVDHLLPALRVGALRRSLWLEVLTTDFGQYAYTLANPASVPGDARPDVALFTFDARHLFGDGDPTLDADGAAARVEAAAQHIVAQWRAARAAFGCSIIQQTLLPVAQTIFGGNEHRAPGAPAALIASLNARLRDLVEAEDATDLLALDTRAAIDGLDRWHDPVLWHRAKQDIHPSAAPLYGDLVARLLAARRGRSAKCLVLDLDNTLWGGVIGDDGMQGIVIGQGSALGEAYVAFQTYARALSRRGIILAVCSKNDEANAMEPFDAHPDMVLRRQDIACFVANWTDKAANVRQIAELLNIGLDSLVFADDNPFERAIVRRELPMVAVPELPEDPALYPRCLSDAGYFEGIRLTAEDLERSGQYQANQARETLRASATDIEGYLRGLNMELRWRRFDRVGQQRIVQLINKTNQFNLTTRRTDDTEIAALIEDDRAFTAQLRLLDQFGDNGIIAILFGRFTPGTTDLVIATWLMSCRVLGRQVEEATMNVVASEAARLGATRIIGEYRPTAKNGMVRDHYEKLGFTPLGEPDPDGRTLWERPVGTYEPYPTFIRIVEG